MRKTILTTSAITMIAASFTLSANAQSVVRFAHMNSPEHFVHIAAEEMAETVDMRTNGEVKIELFPSGQLGENGSVTEQMSFGADLMGQVGIGMLADYAPDYSIVLYPFLYPDFESAKRLLASDLIKNLEATVAENNIKVMCYAHFGVRDLYTRNVEVHSPSDSEGLSIRVQPVTIYTELVRLVFGGAATPMPWPDVYSALAQGVIDAAEAPPSAMIDQKHYENTQFFIQTNHMTDIVPVTVSASWYNNLSEANQAIFQEESSAACDRMSEASIASYEAGIEKLAAEGMTIISDIDRAAFAERAAGIAEAFPEWSPGLYDQAKSIVEGQ
ncbi:TRAP transporter substrate-binding protein [Halomonas sp. HAL1]|uniref:TRAP transporter substrate-binding protein n=1 Tax=Halomonas sp. HAL1 TaxID=550984 RepID=UPI00022D338C|nr:TRAP transporter substrate-binding protein [Halomonas sp. HAL1]EHA16367.1 putative TRAP-type C4-dicarboxylate transport system, periplasmic component [Halomonas sp. HAL1]WKV94198.1 TRAP transporter substrate-binding protein [Halomonas sp. HAL1]